MKVQVSPPRSPGFAVLYATTEPPSGSWSCIILAGKNQTRESGVFLKHEVKEWGIKNYIAILKLNNRQIIYTCDSGI